MNAYKGWRTLGAAVGIAALGALQTYLSTGAGGGLIPLPYVGPVLIAIGFGVAYLRSITDTPAMESTPKPLPKPGGTNGQT